VARSCSYSHPHYEQIDLKFINRYRDTWPAGLQCLGGEIINLKPLVTHTYPLEKALDALHTCSDLSNGSIKVQIVDERDDVF
jgi:L-iditol 2-dehydrogenase